MFQRNGYFEGIYKAYFFNSREIEYFIFEHFLVVLSTSGFATTHKCSDIRLSN